MSWTELQRAMLREMGIPPFWPVPDAQPEAASVLAEPAMPADAARAPLAPQGDSVAAPLPSREAAPSAPAAAAPLGARQAGAGAGRLQSGQVGAPARPAPMVAEAELGLRPAGIESMGWPALREAVAGCQACGLCRSRTQAVFGVGNPHASWMLVGEAPGEQEDQQGEPFVGRAGQLLDRMLQACGLTRAEAPPTQQVFIANVLKCRPPANRNPLPQEVAQCEPFLLRQVALVQPRVIVAMGRFAVQSLLKSSEPIGRLRGKVHQLSGVPLVVTYHPAYLLRNPADKALAWDDLCLAREVLARGQAG